MLVDRPGAPRGAIERCQQCAPEFIHSDRSMPPARQVKFERPMTRNANGSASSLLVQHARGLGSTPAALAAVAIAEQVRIVGLVLEHRGVQVDLLDESSLMHTGTFKAPLAGVAVADLLQNGQQQFMTVSAGNTAEAMAAYATPHGLECFLFVTARSHYKLNHQFFDHPRVHLFELDVPEPELKRVGAEFSRRTGLVTLPKPEHQMGTNKLRALVLADQYRRGRRWYDWTVQSLSGGFGPVGFYGGIEELVVRGEWPVDAVPALLGVQQEGNCPLVPGHAPADNCTDRPLIEPTLYATRPAGAAGLRRITRHYGGEFVAVSNRSYLDRETVLLELLRKHGLPCGRALFAPGQPLVERSGLLALQGAVEAIDRGAIPRGSRVLVCLTGGCTADRIAPVEPELRLAAGESLERFWNAVASYVNNATSTVTI